MQNRGVHTGGAKRGVGETKALVRRHTKSGLTPQEIALVLGISTQAVYQHLKAIRDAEVKAGTEVAS